MRFISGVVNKLVKKYDLYKIYAIKPEIDTVVNIPQYIFKQVKELKAIDGSKYQAIRELNKYKGEEAFAFGIWKEKELVSVCWYWAGKRYKKRNFWPLKEHEAKLVMIVTAPEFRGLGLASLLIQYSANEMRKLGYQTLYARIWHSNNASVSAFKKAGWKYIAFVIRIFFPFIKKPLRITIRKPDYRYFY